jgi:hypothetical protein
MAIEIGKLTGVGIASETAVQKAAGALVVATHFPRFIPASTLYPRLEPLESEEMGQNAGVPLNFVDGPRNTRGSNLKLNVNPAPVMGHIFRAIMGADVAVPPGAAATGYTHTFYRTATSQIPTLSITTEQANGKQGFQGCMCERAVFSWNQRERLLLDTFWRGLEYDDAPADFAYVPSALKPLTFAQTKVEIPTANEVFNVRTGSIEFDNLVNSDHGVGSHSVTNPFPPYESQNWSEGQAVIANLQVRHESNTEYAKFKAATSSSLKLVITSGEDVSGATPGTKYVITLTLPEIYYRTHDTEFPGGVIVQNIVAVGVPKADHPDTGLTCNSSITLLDAQSATYNV